MARVELKKKVFTRLAASDMRRLKKLSVERKTSIAQLMRIGVQRLCDVASVDEEKVFDYLDNVRKDVRKKGISNDQIMKWAVQAQREVRRERYKK